MVELKEILKFIKSDIKGKTWDEIKKHFKWDDSEAGNYWQIYFGTKCSYLIRLVRRTENETVDAWKISPEGEVYLKERSFFNTWFSKQQITTIILSVFITFIFTYFTFYYQESIKKQPDFSITLPDSIIYNDFGYICNDATDFYKNNLTITNRGIIPIKLAGYGEIFQVCSDKEKQIGGIETNSQILAENPINLQFTIDPAITFIAKNCNIEFRINSMDRETNRTNSYKNVEVKICKS